MNREVLRIAMREKGATRLIRLSGELDSYTSDRLRGISEAWIPGAEKVVVNLDKLEYVDSSGLAALVRMWVTARESGVPMVFACRNQRIQRIFEITGLSTLFGTCEEMRPRKSAPSAASPGLHPAAPALGAATTTHITASVEDAAHSKSKTAM